MNNSYFVYAKKLDDIGNKIISISKKFIAKQPDTKSIKGLKLTYAICLESIDGYRICKDALANVIPPAKVKKEHEDLINTMQLFIDGTEDMFRSIDLENSTVNEELMEQGYSRQKFAETIIAQITNIVSAKLT